MFLTDWSGMLVEFCNGEKIIVKKPDEKLESPRNDISEKILKRCSMLQIDEQIRISNQTAKVVYIDDEFVFIELNNRTYCHCKEYVCKLMHEDKLKVAGNYVQT